MRYVTAGESHGMALSVIVSEVPAGLSISPEIINADLARRQSGYGRSARQSIENDTVEILSGVRFGKTIGSPVCLLVRNRDSENWQDVMRTLGDAPAGLPREVAPRPGHADLVGALKTATDDCRDVMERASARETAARVAAAGVAREFLASLGVEIFSYVVSIGDIALPESEEMRLAPQYKPLDIEMSELRCPDGETSAQMMEIIDAAHEAGESLGGTFRVVATGLLPGIGGYANGEARLSSRIGAALFSIPAIKGVEIGLGFESTLRAGSDVHDAIDIDARRGFIRATNRSGGIEGGMSTGEPLVVTAAMKPLPTLSRPLRTVNMETLEPEEALVERADVCAVPAAAVVAECELAFVLAQAYMEKFGSDNMTDILASVKAYKQRLRTVSR